MWGAALLFSYIAKLFGAQKTRMVWLPGEGRMAKGKGGEGWERGVEGTGRRRGRGGEEPALPIKKSFLRSWVAKGEFISS